MDAGAYGDASASSAVSRNLSQTEPDQLQLQGQRQSQSQSSRQPEADASFNDNYSSHREANAIIKLHGRDDKKSASRIIGCDYIDIRATPGTHQLAHQENKQQQQPYDRGFTSNSPLTTPTAVVHNNHQISCGLKSGPNDAIIDIITTQNHKQHFQPAANGKIQSEETVKVNSTPTKHQQQHHHHHQSDFIANISTNDRFGSFDKPSSAVTVRPDNLDQAITVTLSSAPTTPTASSFLLIGDQQTTNLSSGPTIAIKQSGQIATNQEAEAAANYRNDNDNNNHKTQTTSQDIAERSFSTKTIPKTAGQGPANSIASCTSSTNTATRSEVLEKELRRIASERRRVESEFRRDSSQAPPRLQVDSDAPSSVVSIGASGKSFASGLPSVEPLRIATIFESSGNSSAKSSDSSANNTGILSPSGDNITATTSASSSAATASIYCQKQQQQQHQHQHPLQTPHTPKQLAIYINGKIRSNSIFCRSNSGGNFAKEDNNCETKQSPVTNTNTITRFFGIGSGSANNSSNQKQQQHQVDKSIENTRLSSSNNNSKTTTQHNHNNFSTNSGRDVALSSTTGNDLTKYDTSNVNTNTKQVNARDSCTAAHRLNDCDVVRRKSSRLTPALGVNNHNSNYATKSSNNSAGNASRSGVGDSNSGSEKCMSEHTEEFDKSFGGAFAKRSKIKAWQSQSWSKARFERFAGQVGGHILNRLQQTLHVNKRNSNTGLPSSTSTSTSISTPIPTSTSARPNRPVQKVLTSGGTVVDGTPLVQKSCEVSGETAKQEEDHSSDSNQHIINIKQISSGSEEAGKQVIVEDLKQHLQQHQGLNHQQQLELQQEQHQASYKLNPSSMFLRKAMRYYRLWIYCTNIAIFMGTLLFSAATIYVISDYRIKLLLSHESGSAFNSIFANGFQFAATTIQASSSLPAPIAAKTQSSLDNANNLSSGNILHNRRLEKITNKLMDRQHQQSDYYTDPSQQYQQQQQHWSKSEQREFNISLREPALLIAYVAIALQAGILQAIGCFGSIRMKERWIQAFWLGILGLTLFDVVFLIYWLQRYDFIVKSLRMNLTDRLSANYHGNLTISNLQLHDNTQSRILTEILDKIQIDSKCCGISSAQDYHWSAWRMAKIEQFSQNLSASSGSGDFEHDQLGDRAGPETIPFEGLTAAQVAKIIRKVPLVPGVCCRRSVISETKSSPSMGGAISTRYESTQGQHWPQTIFTSTPPSEDWPQTRLSQVPAWSQSPVIDHLPLRRVARPPARKNTLAASMTGNQHFDEDDVIDQRWAGIVPSDVDFDSEPNADSDSDHDRSLMKGHKRRLLSKERYFKSSANYLTTSTPSTEQTTDQLWLNTQPASDRKRSLSNIIRDQQSVVANGDESSLERHKRSWLVSSSVDEQQRVLTWLTMVDNQSNSNGAMQPEFPEEARQETPLDRLNRLRGLLFNLELNSNHSTKKMLNEKHPKLHVNQGRAGLSGSQKELNAETIRFDLDSAGEELFKRSNYKWPNDIDLTFEQYETIAKYLISEQERLESEHEHNHEDQLAIEEPNKLRSVRSVSNKSNKGPSGSQQADSTTSSGDVNNNSAEMLLTNQLRFLILKDPELGCAPRAYHDWNAIHAQGCYPAIKAWLDGSAHILLVAGFCIMTVLKFCSLVLLRLEIREMIHKIKVLKGMATEYNELNDLEVYLPRSSICPPPEVGGSISGATHGSISGQLAITTGAQQMPCTAATGPSGPERSSSATSGPPLRAGPSPYRCLGGGSFSDAVMAATAAAQMGGTNSAVGGTNSLLDSLGPVSLASGGGRAASVKAMAAISSMLSPSLCARSSSAHLPGGVGGSAGAAANLKPTTGYLSASGPMSMYGAGGGGNNVMYRRHTAVSVCPAAAAAAAATAAHHLMSRRGTYIANPFFNAAPLMNAAMGALSQHRHSAHTVYTLSAPTSNLLSPQHHSSAGLASSIQPGVTGIRPAIASNSSAVTGADVFKDQASSSRNNNLCKIPNESSSNMLNRDFLQNNINSTSTISGPSSTMASKNTLRTDLTLDESTADFGGHAGGQLVPLVQHTFKRQSSAGPQYPCASDRDQIASDELTPGQVLESRRSIH